MVKRANVYRHAGFFAIRTPLLPINWFLGWGEGLDAVAARGEPERLSQALATDRTRLRARLRDIIALPEVREALFVASPGLETPIDAWMRDPESSHGRRAERTLVCYFARMAGRPKPFGLFAGTSVGAIARRTSLELPARAKYRRHTRIDTAYLYALVDALIHDPEIETTVEYWPNPTLYRAAGQLRYIESWLSDTRWSYQRAAVQETSHLRAALDLGANGATLPTLAGGLARNEATLPQAERFIRELIESRILVPALAVQVTGDDAAQSLEAQLRMFPPARAVADRLAGVRRSFAEFDAFGLGVSPARYRAVARTLDDLPVDHAMSGVFQVDMMKPASGATLAEHIAEEVMRGVEILHRLWPREDLTLLDRFRRDFVARYRGRTVALLEALDEEIGIGFPPPTERRADDEPLLKDLRFPRETEDGPRWTARDAILLRKLSAALANGAQEIVLDSADIGALATPNPLPLTDAFAALVAIAADSEEAFGRGDYRIRMRSLLGDTGAERLGRFCYASDELRAHVKRLLRAEEKLDPDAVYAEIVHLPTARHGNALARPLMRDYEIPCHASSGAPPERQIPLGDLLISVEGEDIVLRSARLGRRVIPRLAAVHTFSWRGPGIYQFLFLVSAQRTVATAYWRWGPLEAASFLPRVRVGRLVLASARWRLDAEELKRLGRLRDAALFEAVQRWRAEARVPRLVSLADGENELPFDLDNILSVEAFVHETKGRREATLVELFPPPEELGVQGPEGRFVHELVVPFVRISPRAGFRAAPARSISMAQPQPAPTIEFAHTCPPGSEWVVAKLYTGTATADRVLRQVIGPLARRALESRWAEQWFFVRDDDPMWHVRVHFHGRAAALHEAMLPALDAAIAPLLEDGRIWRVQFDTNEREIERYGGADGTLISERFFHIDSMVVLELLEVLPRSAAGADDRWRLAFCGLDSLLSDLGFDASAKRALVGARLDKLAAEVPTDSSLRRQLGALFRRERAILDQLLNGDDSLTMPLVRGREVLRRRSADLAPLVDELAGCERSGRLSRTRAELAFEYARSHVNRLVRSQARRQELVLYDLLARVYTASSARQGRVAR